MVFGIVLSGIDGNMLRWIHNFLADRKIQVKIGNQTSDQHPLQNGCPQGSVISPILFNAIINTLRDHLLKQIGIRLSQFADDGAFYTKKVQVDKDQEKAQSEKDSHSKNRGGKKPN